MSSDGYEFVVDDVFEFSDGSIIFSGLAPRAPPFIHTCRAHIVCNGAIFAEVMIENEMIPTPRAKIHRRVVSTRTPLDAGALRKCGLLVLRIPA